MSIIRAIAGIVVGATVGFFLLAYAERDASSISQVLGALAHILPGFIAGIIARRYVVLAGFLAGVFSMISLVTPYAVIYHYDADNLVQILVKSVGLYGVPCAFGAFAAASVRNSTPPSDN